MLRITDHALSLVHEFRNRTGIPEHFGLRVFGGASQDGQGAFQMGFSEEPFSGDAVTETSGERLFVAPDVRPALDQLILDVEEGEGSARFVLREG